MEDICSNPKIHVGRNIARIRELKGMKQETLATMLGVTQQAVSHLEQKENMDNEKLEEIAQALGVTPETIKAFNKETAFTFINNNHDNSASNAFINGYGYYHQPVFNPVDKIMEQSSKIEELYKALLDSKQELLESEQEKVKVLTEANNAILSLAEEVKRLKARPK